jgi:hypothetical protein
MNYKGHLRAGFFGAIAVSVSYSMIDNEPSRIGFMGGATLIGALAPDLDTDSIPSKITSFIGFAACLISIILKEPYPMLYFSAAFFFVKSFSHRTYTHLYSLPLVMVVLSYYYQSFYFAAFGFGLCVHYFCDSLSVFKPSNWFKFHLPTMLK